MSYIYVQDECPVCYTPLADKYTDYLDGHTLMEHYENCPNGCYSYEYAYGSTRIYITIRGHHIEFDWHWNDETICRGSSRNRNDAINIVVEAARRALLEDLLKEHADRKATAQQG